MADSEEGTVEHVSDPEDPDDADGSDRPNTKKTAKPTDKSLGDVSKASGKQGKIVVDLKHSGNYKSFDAMASNISEKVAKLAENFKADPLSIFEPSLIESLSTSLAETCKVQ